MAEKLRKEPDAEPEMRPIERFFNVDFFFFCKRHKKTLLGIWALISLVGLILVAAKLRPAEELGAFVDDDHDVQRFSSSQREFYSREAGRQIVVSVVMGLDPAEPIDRTGVDYQKPGPNWATTALVDLGVPKYNPGFKDLVSTAAFQQDMLNFCDNVADKHAHLVNFDAQCESEYVNNVRLPRFSCKTGVYCWVHTVQDYVQRCLNETFPVGPRIHEIVSSEGYQNYQKLVENTRLDNNLNFDNRNWRDKTGFLLDNNNEIFFSFISINSSERRAPQSYSYKKAAFDRYEDMLASYFYDTPSGEEAKKSVGQVSFFWVWMVTERELIVSVAQSVGMSTAFAWVVLVLATQNWRIATLGLGSMLTIICTVGGVCVAIGWALGIIESIALIVVVGLSVDYSIHLIHAYNESCATTREDKAREAVTTMGISLVSGVFTTFGSALFLWFCVVIFFRLFGTFLAITVVVSMLVAFTFLIPLTLVIGPEGNEGDVYIPYLSHKMAKKRQAKAAEDIVVTNPGAEL